MVRASNTSKPEKMGKDAGWEGGCVGTRALLVSVLYGIPAPLLPTYYVSVLLTHVFCMDSVGARFEIVQSEEVC